MANKTMKAVRIHQFGGPEVLRYEDVPVPVVKPGEVLIRVRAAALNPPDWYLRDGYRSLPGDWRPSVALPVIPGSDVSGVVEATAPDVDRFVVGDEVFGMVRFPSIGESAGYAELVSAPAAHLARKPFGVDHVHAAGAAMAGLTAWQFLVDVGHDEPNPFQPRAHRPRPLANQVVLVNGAAGGVGHAAVQLAKWQGAQVVAVASGRHERFLAEVGADRFIDYTKQAPDQTVHGADVVLDTVGGAGAARFLKTLKRGGALFPVFPLGFAGHDEAARAGVEVSSTQVRSSGAQLARIGELLAAGTLRIAIDSTFRLHDARRAHDRAAAGNLQGKIVLVVGVQGRTDHDPPGCQPDGQAGPGSALMTGTPHPCRSTP